MPFEGRFEIGAPIHIGQIATAYEAVQKGLERKVLLKIVHPQWKQDPELLERFGREGKAAARVSHHNVVKIYDFGWEDGLPYIILEWIDGGTLEARLKGGPLSQNEVRKIAIELLNGLSAVHKAKLLHRDIKLDNIMLGSDGEARLTDFSLAGLGHVSTLTGHDGIVGSPAYLAPELLNGSSPDERSDLYSLGIVLFEALTGSNPFYASDPMISINRVLNVNPPKLVGRPRLDPQLASLIDALLNKSPDRRPSNTSAALQIIEGQSAVSTLVEPIPIDGRNTHDYRKIGIIGAFAIIVLFLMFFSGKSTDYATPKIAVTKVDLPSRPPILSIDNVKIPIQKNPLVEDIVQQNKETKQFPEVNNYGLLSIIVQPWGSVSLDGELLGTTPLQATKLTSGKHHIEVSHPQLPMFIKDFDLAVNQNETLIVDLQAEASKLIVTANPWGYLSIDGDSLGLLPRSEPIWLKPGTHEILVSHPKFGTKEETITLAKGEHVAIRADFTTGTLIATPSVGGE